MLLDSTLREGAQMFGVYFGDELRREILTGLIRTGVDEVELGWAGQEGLFELLGHAQRLDPLGRCLLTVWSPLRCLDLEILVAEGVQRVHFGVPVSDAHIQKRLGMDRSGLLDRLREVLERASSAQCTYLSVGLEDVSRADRDFSLSVAHVVEECGGRRIRLSDTVGLLTPLETAKMVECFTSRTNLEVAFHGHDDFGMATANAVTALDCGAHSVDVSILGIGERAGIAALEEVGAYLNRTRNTGYDLKECARLARMVAQTAKVPIARNKALVGEDLFACETGLHLQGLAKDPALFEPFRPELVGVPRKLGLGAKTGKAAVRNAASLHGLDLSGPGIEKLTHRVRRLSQTLARPLCDREFKALADSMVSPASSQGSSCHAL